MIIILYDMILHSFNTIYSSLSLLSFTVTDVGCAEWEAQKTSFTAMSAACAGRRWHKQTTTAAKTFFPRIVQSALNSSSTAVALCKPCSAATLSTARASDSCAHAGTAARSAPSPSVTCPRRGNALTGRSQRRLCPSIYGIGKYIFTAMTAVTRGVC